MTLIERLLQTWPLDQWRESRLIVAVSGGADSVALLRALHSIARPEQLHVAHFNHGWRGSESDLDEQFVTELSLALDLSVTIGRPDASSSDAPHSEQHARNERYQFFERLATKHSANFVVTAHTGSDRVETMLHNLCRGTGLAGACSPTVFRMIHPELELVRPLLSCFRTTVIEYLSQICQPYRSDSSNRNQAYRRNFLRHSVLPLLQQAYGPEVERRLLSYSFLAEESLQVQRNLAQSYWLSVGKLEQRFVANDWLPVSHGAELRFPSRNLLAENWTVVQLAIQHHWQKRGWRQQAVTKKHWDALKSDWQTLKEPTRFKQRALRSLYQLPRRIQVSTCNGWLLMQPAPPELEAGV